MFEMSTTYTLLSPVKAQKLRRGQETVQRPIQQRWRNATYKAALTTTLSTSAGNSRATKGSSFTTSCSRTSLGEKAGCARKGMGEPCRAGAAVAQ